MGFIVTNILALIINLNIGLGVVQSLFELEGMSILYGFVQIKNNDVTAWDSLQENLPTNKVFAKAGPNFIASAMCKHQQGFGLDVGFLT